MNKIGLRISLKDNDYKEDKQRDINAVLEYIKSHSSKLIFAVYENPTGDNPHVHFCFTDDSNYTKWRDNFRKQVSKRLAIHTTGKSKAGYAVTDLNSTEEPLYYLCKGRLAVSDLRDPRFPGEQVYPDIVYQGEVTDDEVLRNHSKWWKDHLEMRERKDSKAKGLGLLEEMIENVKSQWVNKEPPLSYTREQLVMDIIDYYISTKRTIRYSQMVEYVDTIWLILLKTYERREEYVRFRSEVAFKLKQYELKKF